MASKKETSSATESLLQNYGDLLFDLCESALWSPGSAQVAFRSILKKLVRQKKSLAFIENERGWVLAVAFAELKRLARNHGRKLSASEQIQLDGNTNVSSRLKQFESYFQRLSFDDQMLLILRDKYGLPYREIASATGFPEGTIKVRRQQALRTLEEWVWDRT